MTENKFHNFTKNELKSIISDHNLSVKQREMMPKLNLSDPKIRRSVDRGRQIALKMSLKERKIIQKGERNLQL